MVGNIIAGSSLNFSFSLKRAADADIIDPQFGQGVLATANTATFSARSTGVQTIDTGSLTFTKSSTSPSGNVVDGASNQVLAKFDVKAVGESMKVESLQIRIDEDDADTTYTLRNGALYWNGQVRLKGNPPT